MAQKFPQAQLIDSWFSVNWSKVNYTLKSQTLTFWSKSSVKDQFIKTCQNMKRVHHEIKKSRFHFEKSMFSNLEIFLSVENFLLFHNFELIFHHDARWFKRNFQYESCRSPWDIKHLFTQLLLEILGSQVINSSSHGHETKHLVKFLP